MTLTQEEAFARIRLLRSPNVGPVSYRQLLRRFGDAATALDALPDLAARGKGPYRPAAPDRIAAEIADVKRAGARYLFHDSPEYPALLGQAGDAPPVLTVKGDGAIAALPSVAVVGARNASAAARRLAREFSAALAEAGFAVVSGLARGIDGEAHRGALATGATVGVIASGIDVAYPPEHADLQNEVGERGLLIAEQPPGTEPLVRHFPSRNRIIAGMAAGTLVVEAAPKSGSLITARLAGEYGREVMAIPGSPLEPRAHGCNQLIREGAMLVQSPDDVIELLSGFDGHPRSTFREQASGFDPWDAPCAGLDDDAAADPAQDPADLASLLTAAPVAIDELVRQSGEGTAAVQLALLELELAGRLERHAGGRVSLKH